MRSISRSQLQQNILHMRFHGCLRNGKVRSDYLVGRAACHFSKYFDFALAEIIFRVMFKQFGRDFLRYIFPASSNSVRIMSFRMYPVAPAFNARAVSEWAFPRQLETAKGCHKCFNLAAR